MASIAFEFTAPSDPNIAELVIYEGLSKDGVFQEIDRVTEVGEYPDYINHYTTDNAQSVDNWFSIAWVDSKGASTPLSDPWQGNTESLVSVIAGRVVQRGITTDETVILQETEATLEDYYNGDPYEVPLPVNYRTLAGLTYLVMARLMILDLFQDTSGGWTAGIVAMQAGSGDKSAKNLQKILDEANRLLGRNYSTVALMEDIDVGNSCGRAITVDRTRLLVELN